MIIRKTFIKQKLLQRKSPGNVLDLMVHSLGTVIFGMIIYYHCAANVDEFSISHWKRRFLSTILLCSTFKVSSGVLLFFCKFTYCSSENFRMKIKVQREFILQDLHLRKWMKKSSNSRKSRRRRNWSIFLYSSLGLWALENLKIHEIWNESEICSGLADVGAGLMFCWLAACCYNGWWNFFTICLFVINYFWKLNWWLWQAVFGEIDISWF